MTNELALFKEGLSGLPAQTNEDAFDSLLSGGYLPRLQLEGANSNAVKEGKIGMGHYALVRSKEDFTDLGKDPVIILLAWRPKAIDMSGDTLIIDYNPESDEFKRIMVQSDVKDSGCMFGVEFLIWCDGEQQFATLYAGSKTWRRAARNLKAHMLAPLKLNSTLIKTEKHAWHGPTYTEYSGPITPPELEETKQQIEKFKNPPANEVEKIEKAESGIGGREV